MASEMIERVADEVGAVFTAEHDALLATLLTPGGAKDTTAVVDALLLKIAGAVLKAMREPTEAMIEAGGDCPIVNYDGNDPREVWQAMLDAALKD
jgi:hypothetical protein